MVVGVYDDFRFWEKEAHSNSKYGDLASGIRRISEGKVVGWCWMVVGMAGMVDRRWRDKVREGTDGVVGWRLPHD